MSTLDPDILNVQPPWLDAQRPRLGRYVLGPLLGQGGMGEVMEAWDVVLCRTVALKVLRNVEPTAVIRFMHEAQIQARIVHPNICRIYDVDATEGNVKIAMQLVRGPNLEQAARDLSVPEVVTLMAQVAEAVHAAHRLKLIHRDLKPSNILLERAEDGRWVPFICDFGLAMAMDEPSLTYSNSVIGTPAYMAPEQFRGLRDLVGPATDVYGLGGTLHFALVGRAPDGPTPSAGAPRRAGLPPAQPITQELPRDLRTVIRKCLEADPELRYPSAAALAEDLWCLVNGQPIRGTLAGPAGRLWRKARPFLKTGLYAALAAGVLVGGWYLEGRRDARRQEALADLEWRFAIEAGDLALDLRMERMLPIHDLRPVYSRVQGRLERLRALLEQPGNPARGPGHLALATVRMFLGDAAGARAEAEQARALGFRTPEMARIFGSSLVARSLRAGGWPTPEEFQLLEAMDARDDAVGPGRDRFNEAQESFLHKDFVRAAAEALIALQAHPWSGGAAALEGLALTAQARKLFEEGDLAGAQARCQEALTGLEGFLERVPSEERVHHVRLLAALALGDLQVRQGRADLARLDQLQERCGQALELDPGSGELLADWLGLQLLEARRLEDLGKDPGPVLDQARLVAETRLKEPLGDSARNQKLGILLHLAMRDFSRGKDPGPALEQALKAPLAAPVLEPDYGADALVFRARVALARGADPRPAVAAALAHLQGGGVDRPAWTACEAAAEAWLIQGEWEAGHGLAAAESLRQARSQVAVALRQQPNSGAGLALEGLICVQDLKATAGAGPGLLLQARDRLRQARALGAGGRLQAQLAERLVHFSPNAS